MNGVMRLMILKFLSILIRKVGTADSGDIESDFPALLESIAEATLDRNTAVAIIIDELQYLSAEEMSALIMAIHRVATKKLPLALVGAGLPQLVGLTGNQNHMQNDYLIFPRIGPLETLDAIAALGACRRTKC